MIHPSQLERLRQRRDALTHFGPPEDVAEVVLTHLSRELPPAFVPVERNVLASEPFVLNWLALLQEAGKRGVLEVLQEAIFELTFPIAEGMSRGAAYQALSLPGWGSAVPPRTPDEDKRPHWEAPERWRLTLCGTVGGLLPVIEPSSRHDFVQMVQAIIHRNEPVPVPDSIGAFLVSGYTNRKVYRQVREAVALGQLALEARDPRLWSEKFLLLSSGDYSSVPHQDMALDQEAWAQVSRQIRIEHEGCHYLVRRHFPRMAFGLQDELIADMAGLMAALGRFQAGHFLRFMGIDESGAALPSGRFAHYQVPLSAHEEARKVVGKLLVAAARNLEEWFKPWEMGQWIRWRHLVIPALTWMSLEEMAAPDFSKTLGTLTGRNAYD